MIAEDTHLRFVPALPIGDQARCRRQRDITGAGHFTLLLAAPAATVATAGPVQIPVPLVNPARRRIVPLVKPAAAAHWRQQIGAADPPLLLLLLQLHPVSEFRGLLPVQPIPLPPGRLNLRLPLAQLLFPQGRHVVQSIVVVVVIIVVIVVVVVAGAVGVPVPAETVAIVVGEGSRWAGVAAIAGVTPRPVRAAFVRVRRVPAFGAALGETSDL